MSDDPNNRGTQDGKRINVNQEHEVRYWTEAFGCTEQQLRDAVDRVGVMAADVRSAVAGSGR